jgi:hypothetical protein
MWNNYFKPPFELSGIKVFDSEFRMAFDFLFRMFKEDATELNEQSRENIVNCLNGTYQLKNDYNFSFDYPYLLIESKPFAMIRGWGSLTGIGGHNLSSEEAVEVQKSLGEYIVKQLNK